MSPALKRSLIILCSLVFVGMAIGILMFGSSGMPGAEEHELIRQLREFARP
jgi:hypothetical protein